jgi:LysR family nitrogen assimilation transcriptional regulator
MDIRSLRYFVSIVHAGSLSRASRELYIAQPALSQHIKRLEAEIGEPLLVRHPRGVAPTAAGELLLRHALRIVSDVEYALAQVRQNASEAVGTVNVGLPQSLGMRIAAPLLQQTLSRYPKVLLSFHEASVAALPAMLTDGSIDLAVMYNVAGSVETARRLSVREDVYVVGPPGRFAPVGAASNIGAELSLKEIFRLPLVLGPRGQWFRDCFQEMAARHDAAINIVAEMDSLAVLLEAARSGCAYTLLTSTTADVALTHGRLSGARIKRFNVDRPVYVYHSLARPASRAVLEVQALIQTEIERLAAPVAAKRKARSTRASQRKTSPRTSKAG